MSTSITNPVAHALSQAVPEPGSALQIFDSYCEIGEAQLRIIYTA